MLKAVITADIANSRKQEAETWLETLKGELNLIGKEPQDWEIYRGDSLQLMTAPENALRAAMQIKAAIMQHKDLDIRMAIGIGDVSYKGKKITESNGSAFIHSGTKFDELGKEQNIVLKSPWKDFDEIMNLLLLLLGKLTNNWNTNRALIVRTFLDNPVMTQKELGQKLNKQQGNISHSLNKAGYDELIKVLDYYESHILERING